MAAAAVRGGAATQRDPDLSHIADNYPGSLRRTSDS